MRKDTINTKDILAIILAVFGIILSLTKKDFTTLILLITLTISVIIVMVLMIYIKKIESHEEQIEEIKEKFKTAERLNKLEIKVFGR